MQEYLFSDYKFNDVEKHQLTHREVFLSRQIETVNASLIRGKCSVRILSEAENMQQYIKGNIFIESTKRFKVFSIINICCPPSLLPKSKNICDKNISFNLKI